MENRGNWKSKIGFVLAASGSAIGLGNIWRFPYTTGKNGGAVFVLVYILAVIFVALPVLLAESGLGRYTQLNPVGAFRKITPQKKWHLIGYLGLTSGVMILSYYSVIAGWTVSYFIKAISKCFHNLNAQTSEAIFTSFITDWKLQISFVLIFISLTALIIFRGISAGIEKVSRVLMPLLFLLLLTLVIFSLTLPGAGKGLNFYLKPDLSRLSFRVLLEAMGQAFFSLSLGMGTMLTYGSYLRKEDRLDSCCYYIATFDMMIALLAGFLIFPAVFSFNMDPSAGPGLVFVTLPVIFSQLPGGTLFGSLFFLLLIIAALTSTISLLEVPVSFLIDEKKWPRGKATLLFAIISLFFGIPSALSGTVPFLQNLPLFKVDFITLWDKIWGNISLGLGALLLSIFVAYVWKAERAQLEIFIRPGLISKIWFYLIKYIAPLLILLIFVSSIVS